MKNQKELERIFKGCANIHRLNILLVLERRPKLSGLDIADTLRGDFRTISEHLRKLALAGLITKRRNGLALEHLLTDTGARVLGFCRNLE